MRNHMLAFSLLLFSVACVPGGAKTGRTVVAERTDGGYVDLSKYSDDGFLITPEGYLGDYSTVAIVDITLYPRAQLAVSKHQSRRTAKWTIDDMSLSDAIDQVVADLQDANADALINFRVLTETREVVVEQGIGATCRWEQCTIELTGFRIAGLGIRRLSETPQPSVKVEPIPDPPAAPSVSPIAPTVEESPTEGSATPSEVPVP